jgi:hypothetical protein
MKITYWVIKHAPTGHFLLGSLRKGRIGISKREPYPFQDITSPKDRTLAMFISRKSAQKGLEQWLRGRMWRPYDKSVPSVSKVHSRKKEFMEIVPVTLSVGEEDDNTNF